MSEKRKYKRKTTIPVIKVFDLEKRKIIGHLWNFSLDGMMVISSQQAIQEEKKFQLELLLPKKVAGKDKIKCNAECKWSTKRTELIYNSGFHFVDISAEEVNLIEYWFHDRID